MYRTALTVSPIAFGARPPDEEEDDIYNTAGTAGASSSSRAFAFDTAEPDEDVVVMGGPSRADANRPDRAGRAVLGRTVPDDVERWHDGRPVLVGFMLDPKGVPPDKW
jgi:G patch domain-containing protein 1